MTPKDALYNYIFKDLMSKNLTQKQAGDAAARAVNLWTHGREYKRVVETIMDEMKPAIKAAKKKTSKRLAA